MKKIGLFLTAVVLCSWGITDSYAWEIRRKNKKTASSDTIAVKESRYKALLRKATSDLGMFSIHRVERD